MEIAFWMSGLLDGWPNMEKNEMFSAWSYIYDVSPEVKCTGHYTRLVPVE